MLNKDAESRYSLHEVRSVLVDKGTESQSVPEGGRHVGDGHIPVVLTLDPAPLLQRLDGSHPKNHGV